MENCGSNGNTWDYQRANEEIQAAIASGHTLVLPLASLIESGNHIAHAPNYRYETALRLADVIGKTADQRNPWAAFTDQAGLWTAGNLKRLSQEWPKLANRKVAIGDATIAHVANFYRQMGCEVRLLTGDSDLSKFEPLPPTLVPRRRRP